MSLHLLRKQSSAWTKTEYVLFLRASISPAQARIVLHERFKFKRYMWTGKNDLKSFDENIHLFSKFHNSEVA